MRKLKGKKALVTGADVGIGRAIALEIARNGGKVFLTSKTPEGLEDVKEEIDNLGSSAEYFSADLRDQESIQELWNEVTEKWEDGADILVNAAGVWHSDDKVYYGPGLEETPVDQINEVMDVGIRAPMILTRLVLKEMIEQGEGKILNISGTFESGASGWLHYYVSKKAIEDFTRGLAEEVREHEIQVNCISPSDTESESYKEFFPDYKEKDVLDPSEVANFAVFLLSEEADHITGSVTAIRNKGAY